MAAIFIRTVIIYLLLLTVMRISGKRQVGEIQLSELVTTFMLSDIATYPLTNAGIPILNAVIPLLTIIPLEIIFSFLTTKCAFIKKLLDGKPSVIVRRGKLCSEEMERTRLSLDDLLCELRLKSIASLDDVDFAILEQNGQISVFPKNGDALSHPIVIDGVIDRDAMRNAEKTEHDLRALMRERNLSAVDEIFLLSITADGAVTLIRQSDLTHKKGKGRRP